MSKEIDELVNRLSGLSPKNTMSQIRFATCTKVDWDNRIMEANGVTDELPYYGVMLGFGFVDIKPKVGSLCLIGILEGKDTYSFLINAEDVDEVYINSAKIINNGGNNSGIVKSGELVKKLNAIEKDLNALKKVFKSWVPVPKDGGAKLKAASASWAASDIIESKQKDIENENITH